MGSSPPTQPPPSGKPPSFADIFPFALDYIRQSVRRMGVSEGDGDDVAQKSLLVVHRCLSSRAPSRSLKPWLHRIAWYEATRHLDHVRRRRETWMEDSDFDLVDPAPTSEELTIAQQNRRIMQELLQTIALERRVVLILHDLDGVAMKDIAREHDIPINTAYTRLRLAREDLRAAWERRQRNERGLSVPFGLPSLHELLAAERELPAVSEAAHDHMWTRLKQDVEAEGIGAAEGIAARAAGGVGAAAYLGPLPAMPAYVLGTVAVVAGLGLGAPSLKDVLWGNTTAPPRPPIAAHASDSASPDLAASPHPSDPPGTPGVEAPMAPTTAPNGVTMQAPPSAPTGAIPIADVPPPRSSGEGVSERKLIQSARTAIARTDFVGAIAALKQHGRVFPRGVYAQEREAMLRQLSGRADPPQGPRQGERPLGGGR
jgi:RNA polymerase sigma factor (sigma-70 family)